MVDQQKPILILFHLKFSHQRDDACDDDNDDGNDDKDRSNLK